VYTTNISIKYKDKAQYICMIYKLDKVTHLLVKKNAVYKSVTN